MLLSSQKYKSGFSIVTRLKIALLSTSKSIIFRSKEVPVFRFCFCFFVCLFFSDYQKLVDVK